MRVLILADRPMSVRERSLLARLEIGLVNEGVELAVGRPRAPRARRRGASLAHELDFEPMAALGRTRLTRRLVERWPVFGVRAQAARVVDALDALGDAPLDVVHVVGDEAWRLGASMALRTGARLCVEVSSPRMVSGAARLAREVNRRGVASMLLGACEPLRRRLTEEADGAHVAGAPWGVYATREPTREVGATQSFVMLAPLHDARALSAALEGFADAVGERADVMLFLDAAATRASRGVWQTIQERGLAERTSLTPDVESRRDMALRADVLIQPEGSGAQRSITLDAMAAGMTLIAARDAHCPERINNATALVVEEPSSAGWAEAVRRVLSDPEAARDIGRQAHEHVRQHRTVSAHIAGVMDAYRRLTPSDSIPFPRT